MNNILTRGYYQTTPLTPINQYYQQPSYYQTPTNWYGQGYQQSQIVSNNEITTNIQWVESQSAAESFQLGSGISSWALWDSKSPIIYVKSFDQNGKPYTKRLQYIDLDAPVQPDSSQDITIDTSEFVTQEQLSQLSDQLSKQMADLQKKLNDFKSRMGNSNKKEK